jgi:hypothetical protein
MSYGRHSMNDLAAHAAEEERRRAEADAVGKAQREAAVEDFDSPQTHDRQPRRSRGILSRIRQALGR